MKGIIDQEFVEVLEYLIETGHVKLEHYFADGTKIEPNANKHKVVWAKQKDTCQKQIQELLQQIEQANADEQAENGEKTWKNGERKAAGKSTQNA